MAFPRVRSNSEKEHSRKPQHRPFVTSFSRHTLSLPPHFLLLSSKSSPQGCEPQEAGVTLMEAGDCRTLALTLLFDNFMANPLNSFNSLLKCIFSIRFIPTTLVKIVTNPHSPPFLFISTPHPILLTWLYFIFP
ncbi:unnamed protein product [Rangifer tarandus platyrhynchus]|uniref:Uncharacterized protein n=1 Tax=Rangifer tarandus platyrhynchus TaxID=3082113 RepID=A0AC59ZQT9_RANTA